MPFSIPPPELRIREQTLEIVHSGVAHVRSFTELSLALGIFETELMAAAAMVHFDFSRSGQTKTFGAGLMSFHFSHL